MCVIEPASSEGGANAGGRATREKLLVTAERLFAKHGIDGVSLREILDEAGQRNKSAAQYHFGGKDGLVIALANYRSGALNERRMALLDEIEATGQQGDVRSLATTIVYPLAELLDERENNFLGFLARYYLDRPFRRLAASVDPAVIESYRRAGRLLRSTSGLPKASFEIRFSLVLDMCFASLANRQAQEESGMSGLHSRDQFVDTLVDAVHAIFAPR